MCVCVCECECECECVCVCVCVWCVCICVVFLFLQGSFRVCLFWSWSLLFFFKGSQQENRSPFWEVQAEQRQTRVVLLSFFDNLLRATQNSEPVE